MHAAGTPLSDWLARLETLSPVEIDLGLERVTRLLDRLALSRPATVLHVAGTNGKGSSVAMADALLRAAGYKVGAYTSPHIVDYNERIVVGADPVRDTEIISAFERIESVRNDIARLQLVQSLATGMTPPPGLVGIMHDFFYETRIVNYLVLTPEDVGDISAPTEEELSSFHASRPDLFNAPEYRSIDYVVIGPDQVGEFQWPLDSRIASPRQHPHRAHRMGS